ncbi:hypothetical protein MMC16_007203 [Acarospora aff. strigata]|nr:hypothetical protein [Acarospora aff. strigata]
MILRASDGQGIKPSDRIYASCIAGGFAGGSTAALMSKPSESPSAMLDADAEKGGRANIMPGTLMFSLFGFVGQAIFNSLDARQIARTSVGLGDSSRPGSFWRRLGESKWTPVKVLSDEEYENMLQEKLLKVIAEIAIIDEKVEKLKETPDSVQTQGSQEKRNT